MPHIHRRQSLGAESLGMIVLWIMLICAQAALAQTGARVEGKEIRIDFNQLLHSRVVARLDGKEIVNDEGHPKEGEKSDDEAHDRDT